MVRLGRRGPSPATSCVSHGHDQAARREGVQAAALERAPREAWAGHLPAPEPANARQPLLRLLRAAPDGREPLHGGRARHLPGDGPGPPRRARGAPHESDQPVRRRVRLAGRRRLVLRRAGVPDLLVRALRARAPRVVRGLPVRDLRRAASRALQRPHGHGRPPVLRGPLDPGGGRRGDLRGDPAPGRARLARAPGLDRSRHLRGGAVDGVHVPLLELQGARLRAPPAGPDAPGGRAGRDDRGHELRALPVPHLRRLHAVGSHSRGDRRARARDRPGRPDRAGASVSQEGHMDRVIIFDTTLRDGEQSPGFSMNTMEKLEMARQLARLNVDVIEAGFPISSEEDFEATREVARQVGTLPGAPSICGLSRVGLGDIDRCWEAVKYATKPRIHTFVATSDIHLKYKLRKSRAEVMKAAVEAVRHARGYCEDVEFSPEDASRSDFDYMCDVLDAVISAGARTINIPDTVGYTIPQEWAVRISSIRERLKRHEGKYVLSVHCHNDLGQAVANSLTGVMNGARQIECTINGIGERAGNASLEGVVMALRTRKDFFGIDTGVKTEELFRTSRLLSHITGIHVQPNKAIVGENAFAHEAGIHQDGVLKEKSTYEIMKPEDIGRPSNKLVLGKHSGRAALNSRLKELGFELQPPELDRAFKKFKDL